MCTINRNYKDRLFRKLFGDPANKSSLLSLYNALMHTDHTTERCCTCRMHLLADR